MHSDKGIKEGFREEVGLERTPGISRFRNTEMGHPCSGMGEEHRRAWSWSSQWSKEEQILWFSGITWDQDAEWVTVIVRDTGLDTKELGFRSCF